MFICLLYIFGHFLDHILNYSLSCECHPEKFCERYHLLAERGQCHMRGRRLADICCGGFERFVDEAGRLAVADLLSELAGSPSAALGMQEFQTGKQFVASELKLRVQAHYNLPIRPLSMGHPDQRKARAGLGISLALFDAKRRGWGHPFCQRLFGPGDLRDSSIAVVNGHAFTDHPRLLRERRKAYFASSSEVTIERDHAAMHRHILNSPKHSKAYASCQLRKPELIAHVESSKDNLLEYCDCLNRVRTPKSMAEVLGLLGHPAIEDPAEVEISEIRAAVYRCDLQTQYSHLPNFLRPPPGPKGPPPPPPAAPPGEPPGSPPHGDDSAPRGFWGWPTAVTATTATAKRGSKREGRNAWGIVGRRRGSS